MEFPIHKAPSLKIVIATALLIVRSEEIRTLPLDIDYRLCCAETRRSQMATELLSSVDVENFFDFINFELRVVSECCWRWFG